MPVLATALLVSPLVAGQTVAFVNGDFSHGGALWTVGVDASVADADGDDDLEAVLDGCGFGDIRLARGLSMGPMPATTKLAFDVETGSLTWYSIRVILANAEDPEPYANNLYGLDATGTLQPDWFDDDVLAWEGSGPVSGSLVLDPVDAIAFNIDGWAGMTGAERAEELSTYAYATLVVYGCGPATLDDFAWVV